MVNGKCPKCNCPIFKKDASSIECLNCFNNASNNKILDKEQLNNLYNGIKKDQKPEIIDLFSYEFVIIASEGL